MVVGLQDHRKCYSFLRRRYFPDVGAIEFDGTDWAKLYEMF